MAEIGINQYIFLSHTVLKLLAQPREALPVKLDVA